MAQKLIHDKDHTLTDCFVQDIMKDAVDSGIKSVTQVPYFEGDFWPNVLEDCAKALDGDEGQGKRNQESAVDEDAEDSSCSSILCREPLGKVYDSVLYYSCFPYVFYEVTNLLGNLEYL